MADDSVERPDAVGVFVGKWSTAIALAGVLVVPTGASVVLSFARIETLFDRNVDLTKTEMQKT